ncbi:MAG TPA: O-antigen ligase family protein [Polyangiaceae bacterium]|jgi:hypothetical protein|nr:O-antigen ligase family protein [Polyangiaceae bacterium]
MAAFVPFEGAEEPDEPSIAASGARRRRRRKRAQRTDIAGRALLAAAAIASVLGLGGLHWATVGPAVALALAAGILAIEAAPSPVLYRPAAVPLAFSAFTLLQAVPMPLALLRVLSPHAAEMWAGAFPTEQTAAHWFPLTADPGATYIEAFKWLGYSGILAASIAIGARRGVRWTATLLFISAVVVGALTFAHGLLGVHKVFGVYEPMFQATRWHTGPLLNPNNLAGYLNLGLLSGTGLLLSREPQLPRIVVGLGVASLIGVVVICASRAGLVALLFGLVVFVFYLRRIFKARGQTMTIALKRRLVLSLGGLLVAAVLFVFLGLSSDTLHELLDKNVEKLDVMTHVAPLVKDYRWFGVGRGAFESVFPAYHVGATNVVYAQPENFVLQWIAEWGVPVGVLAIVALGVLLWHAQRSATRITNAGMWAGLCALLAQNLLDLGFEVPGLVFAGLIAAGSMWGENEKALLEPSFKTGAAPRLGARALAIAAWLVLGTLVIVVGRHGVTRDRLSLRNSLAKVDVKNSEDVARLRGELKSDIQRHPADPYFARIGGVLAYHAHDQSPIPWLRRALDRGMEVGSTHYVVARVLERAGARRQALFEVKLAVTYQPGLTGPAARVVTPLVRTFDDILVATPEGAAGQGMLNSVAMGFPRDEPRAIRLRCLEESIARAPTGVHTRAQLASDVTQSIAQAKDGDSLCGGTRRNDCVKLVNEQVRQLVKLAPEDPAALIAKAQLMLVLGQAPEAEALLHKGCAHFVYDRYAGCERVRVRAAAATHSKDLLDSASRDLAASGCGFGANCAELDVFLGDQAAGIGDLGRALSYYQKAVSDEPTDAHWTRLARTASILGEVNLASKAWAQISNRNPDDSEVRHTFEEAQSKAMMRILEKPQ